MAAYTTLPVAPFSEQFRAMEASRNGGATSPVHALRRAAMDRLAERGFPTQRHEEWRYTNLSPIFSGAFAPIEHAAPVQAEALTPYSFVADAAATLVFIDGWYSEPLSARSALPAGVTVLPISDAIASADTPAFESLDRVAAEARTPFSDLNSALSSNGAFVHVGKDVVLEQPIHLIFLSGSSASVASYPRVLIRADRASAVTIVESYGSLTDNASFTDAQTEIIAGEGAIVDHYRMLLENARACHVASTFIDQQRGSTCSTLNLVLGGGLVRTDLGVVLNGEGCEATLNGLTLAQGTQHVDNHTMIDHAQPHCASHELYKSVMDDSSRGVFSGRIIVRPGAQKTDAKQSNNSLLLAESASADSKPQLEIFADDVKCTHGATVGRLSDDALFYLRSRGIGASDARALLTYAFASEIVSGVRIPSLRDHLDAFIHQRLQKPPTTS